MIPDKENVVDVTVPQKLWAEISEFEQFRSIMIYLDSGIIPGFRAYLFHQDFMIYHHLLISLSHVYRTSIWTFSHDTGGRSKVRTYDVPNDHGRHAIKNDGTFANFS